MESTESRHRRGCGTARPPFPARPKESKGGQGKERDGEREKDSVAGDTHALTHLHTHTQTHSTRT